MRERSETNNCRKFGSLTILAPVTPRPAPAPPVVVQATHTPPPQPAAFPSRLRAGGRTIVDENNHVLPTLKGFNMHVEPGFTWDQSHFDAIAALGGRINRAILHWDDFEPSSGVVSAAAIAALDLHVTRAAAGGIYTMLELHLNVGRTPAWTSAHGPEMEKYAAYGQTLTQYLAHRYGDPASPQYTKAVIGFGLNEPPIENAAIRNGDQSIPYLEGKQRQMIAWMRAPGNAPNWIGFVAVGYAGATPLYDRGKTPGAVNASPTAYASVGGNVVLDVHDYMMGCEVVADNSLSTDPNCDGRQRNGQKHPTHQGGPLINTNAADHSSYVSTPATRGQMKAFLKPYKDFTTQAAIPLMVGEFGWPKGKAGEVAWITDKKVLWADAGTAIEIQWNYDVNSANSIWSARAGGRWSPAVTTWMRP